LGVGGGPASGCGSPRDRRLHRADLDLYDRHHMIASSGGIVQSSPPCHQNSRSLRPAPSRGSAGHFRRCLGDFRGRLLSHGCSLAGLVADFYPRHRHPRHRQDRAQWRRVGCSAAGDSSRIRSADRSSPGIGGGLGGWRTARVQRQPSSSRASVGAATVAMIANRTVAKTAAANKMATPFIKTPCIPRQEYLPLPCCRMEVRRRCSNPPENFGTVADP
jgi:hypothetical protein